MISGMYLLVALAAAPQQPTKSPATSGKQAAPSFESLSKQADTARQQERLDEAIGAYRRALKLRPSWKEGWWYLATLLYDQDHYPEARDGFAQLVKLDGKNGPALALLGLCEYQTKDYGSALTHLNRARALGFGDNKQMASVTFYHNAILLTRFERFESALELLLEMVKRGMNSPKVVEAAGLAALRMPTLPPDIRDADRELILLTGRAVCTAGERNAVEATKQFQEVVAKFPAAPNVHYVYGAYLLMSSPDEGLREMLKELDVSRDHLPSLVAISFEYLKRGETEKGVEFAERAVKSAPNSFAAHAALGRALVESGKTEEGIQSLELAEKLAPDSPQVRIALASAYTKVGRSTDAARERAEFLKLKNATAPEQQ